MKESERKGERTDQYISPYRTIFMAFLAPNMKKEAIPKIERKSNTMEKGDFFICLCSVVGFWIWVNRQNKN